MNFFLLPAIRLKESILGENIRLAGFGEGLLVCRMLRWLGLDILRHPVPGGGGRNWTQQVGRAVVFGLLPVSLVCCVGTALLSYRHSMHRQDEEFAAIQKRAQAQVTGRLRVAEASLHLVTGEPLVASVAAWAKVAAPEIVRIELLRPPQNSNFWVRPFSDYHTAHQGQLPSELLAALPSLDPLLRSGATVCRQVGGGSAWLMLATEGARLVAFELDLTVLADQVGKHGDLADRITTVAEAGTTPILVPFGGVNLSFQLHPPVREPLFSAMGGTWVLIGALGSILGCTLLMVITSKAHSLALAKDFAETQRREESVARDRDIFTHISKAEARKAREAREHFTSLMHYLNGRLQSIAMKLTVAQMGAEERSRIKPAVMRESIQTASEVLKDMRIMLQNLTTYLIAGSDRPIFTDVDRIDVCVAAREILSGNFNVARTPTSLMIYVPTGRQLLAVCGDQGLVTTAVVSCLRRALHGINAGGGDKRIVRVHLMDLVGLPSKHALYSLNYAQHTDGLWCCIEIEDTGRLLEQKEIGQMFVPQLRSPDDAVCDLTHAASIIEVHRGMVTVDSEVMGAMNRTIFRLYFPSTGKISKPNSKLDRLSVVDDCIIKSDRTVFVVEDDKEVLVFLETALRGFGFKVETASSAEEMFALCHRSDTPPLAIFLDHRLGHGANGALLAPEIKRCWPGQTVKIVHISGTAFEFGADPQDIMLAKPFGHTDITWAVLKLLNDPVASTTTHHSSGG